MSEHRSAIVIGGGVVGCCAAYYLTKLGWRVRLVEAGHLGKGCSHGNCGFICTSHVLPLTSPGAVWDAIRKTFDKDAAIYVKPQFDPALWGWLMRFALRCRPAAMMRTAQARHALLASSMKLYRELLADESLDVEWQDRGLMLVFRSSRGFNAYAQTAALVSREFGIQATAIEGDALPEFEPSLRAGLAGGWHYPGDAHLRPDRLMTGLAEVLRSRGVEILEGVTVTGIDVHGSRARAVETSRGSMESDLMVVAAGAETPKFAQQLGCRIPIQPGKGYSITMPRPEHAPTIPMIFGESHVAVTPWPSGLRIGSTMEFVGYDQSINRRRLELFKRVTAEHLVGPHCAPVEEEWYGWRPMTYDDLPCIGRAPKVENVIVAAGHGMIGIATATATGKLVAELATDAEPHLDPTPFALSRFGR